MLMLLVSFVSFIGSIVFMARLASSPDSYRWSGIFKQIICMCAVFGCFFWILVSLVKLSVLDM